MEKYLKIKTDDHKIIYGTLNADNKKDELIIFVHGLSGHQDEHIFYNAARFFPKRGFSTFRFDLYSGSPKARILSECTIQTHAKDINTVINYFAKNYHKIFLVGHSLGGPSVLLSDIRRSTAIVLWDPSLKLEDRKDEMCRYDTRIKRYVLQWGSEVLVSKEMIDGWENLDKRMIEKITKPTKVICAGRGILKKHWIKNIKSIKAMHAFTIIKDADHCFNSQGSEERLLKETLDWFRKF